MTGRVDHLDLVELAPPWRELHRGDVVLCQVGGRHYLHLVDAVAHGQYRISNNRGHVNGWTPRHMVFGLLVAVNPQPG